MVYVDGISIAMSVQLDVSTHGFSSSVSLDLPSARELGVSEDEERATAAAILGCVGESARKDATLTEEQSSALQLQPSTKSEEEDTAVLVGRTIVNWAEEIDQRLSGDELVRGLVDSCVSETDSGRASHQTFQIFQKIVRVVLECDQNGLATKMTYGRLAALFGLGYMLCKAFVKTHSVQLVCDFVKQVIGYVIRFLAESRFFSWLKVQGGWGTLLKSSLATARTNNYVAVAGAVTVVVGFVLLAVGYCKCK